MCGIAGFKTDKRVDDSVIKNMVQALYHRGPDSEGFYSSGDYTAGMRRLIINDLKTGDQPLYNMDRSVALLYNGEIYNSPQLRKDLQSKGYKFKTHSDGEVICHLYDEYKEELFEKLDGMFAIALWIEKEKKLILARDIPGEKPLYYAKLPNNGIAFASEIKSLKCFPGIDLAFNYQAIWDFPTFLWVPESNTIYESIHALLPGHMLIADDSDTTIKRFENKFNTREIDLSDESVIKETRSVVEDAIKSRLLSDVNIGSFLSSGLDSSIVTTIAAKNLDRLDTFTISFEDLTDPYHGTADESIYAKEYARKLGTRHHTVKVYADTFSDLLDTFCKNGDQPFAVSSGLGILAVAKSAREAGIKVLLSGDGADEGFGGYSWYRHINEVAKMSGNPVGGVDNLSFQNFGLSLDERLKHLSSFDAHKRQWAWHYYASENEKEAIFSREPFSKREPSPRFFQEFNPDKRWNDEDYIRQDRCFYLPNEMLKKVDRMTMAYSVEGRSPYVAPSILSHSDKLRYSHMSKNGTLKWALRKAFEDILPSEVTNRPKHGFNVPVDHWLKGEWSDMMGHTFSKESALYKNGIIHKDSVRVATEMLNDKIRLNGHTIFTYIMLNMWMERYH
ncbi:asparagine synthase (glutamine-hydrolyzing) [Candidatus Omnitrophota bacterium]